ncbi:LysR substrate-binding domain-containing protein [Ramlibacter sp. MMS24-I3-19]|uniref:LysR substrate-binding domain-containing protein n=1 Tax=Ramlibacter sp. MMS24-I3-19 TaxID=3416606 RepID=UPI003CFF5B4B
MPIITNSPPSTLNAAVRQWLRSGGLDFDAVNSCNSLSLMLRLVRAGHAIAVLPTPVLREQLASGEVRCLPAEPRIPPIAYYASYVKDESGRDVSVVVEIARTVLADARFFTDAPTSAQTSS